MKIIYVDTSKKYFHGNIILSDFTNISQQFQWTGESKYATAPTMQCKLVLQSNISNHNWSNRSMVPKKPGIHCREEHTEYEDAKLHIWTSPIFPSSGSTLIHQCTPSPGTGSRWAWSNGNNQPYTLTAATGAYRGYLIPGMYFCSPPWRGLHLMYIC